MDDELSRILAFSQAVEDASATTLVRFRFGTAVFNAEFPHSWMHNFLRVDGRRPTALAAALAQEADRLHGEVRHAHRAIVVDDEVTGARLRPGLEERGYKVERNVIMVHRRPPDRLPDTSVVEQVDAERLRPLLEEYYRAEPYGTTRRSCASSSSEACLPRPSSMLGTSASVSGAASLAAAISIETAARPRSKTSRPLESYRGRGYARAAVTRVLEEAADADLVFLYADEDDWPKELYRKLGFDPLALMYLFTRSPA